MLDAGTATRFAPAEGFDAGTPRSFNACCISRLSVSPACSQEQRSEHNAAALRLSTEQWQITSLLMMETSSPWQATPAILDYKKTTRALATNTARNTTPQAKGLVLQRVLQLAQAETGCLDRRGCHADMIYS